MIKEVIEIEKSGISKLEAIRSATAVASSCLKISASKGALSPGMDADMVVDADNPLQGLAVLLSPVLIINGGKVFLINKLPAALGR